MTFLLLHVVIWCITVLLLTASSWPVFPWKNVSLSVCVYTLAVITATKNFHLLCTSFSPRDKPNTAWSRNHHRWTCGQWHILSYHQTCLVNKAQSLSNTRVREISQDGGYVYEDENMITAVEFPSLVFSGWFPFIGLCLVTKLQCAM